MATFGRNWLEDNDDYDFNMFSSRYSNDNFEYPKEVEKPKQRLSNEQIIKILKSRSKKDLNLILNKINEKN